MNVSSTTALTHELNPLEPSFSPTDGPTVHVAKILNFNIFEDCLKTTEVRPGVYKKSVKQDVLI